MALSKILVLCESSSRFARVRGACGALGRGILRGVTSCEDALEILADGSISMVIVDRAEAFDFEAVCSLVQMASMARRSCPVVVLTEHYDEAEATLLFRLGVTDCLDYFEHEAALTPTVARLARLECPSPMELEMASRAYPAPRSRRLTATV